jgi:hypothetical protein
MSSKTQDVVLVLGLAVAGYVVYKLFSAASSAAGAVGAAASAVGTAAANAYQSTVSAVASGFYAVFGPADIGSSTYYLVNFPDGARHAVPGNTVDSSGNFTWTGYPPGSQPAMALTLVKDSSGAWYATQNG